MRDRKAAERELAELKDKVESAKGEASELDLNAYPNLLNRLINELDWLANPQPVTEEELAEVRRSILGENST